MSKIKPNKAEGGPYNTATQRRRILEAAESEKAVVDLNEFLAKEGITEEEWKRRAEMRGRRKEKG